MVWLRVLSRINLVDPFLPPPSNPQPFKNLPPLKTSCLSFSDSRPLFSIACALFLQNTRGMVSRSDFWTLGGSRRRLPVTEMVLGDTGVAYPARLGLCANSLISASQRYPFPRFSPAGGHSARFSRQLPTAPVSTFRINTCKSVSKQTTLSSFRINTCEKPRGGGADQN